MFDYLIGCEVVSVKNVGSERCGTHTQTEMILRNNNEGRLYSFKFDCYADPWEIADATLVMNEDVNPVITNIEVSKTDGFIDDDEEYYGERAEITLFGISKVLAQIKVSAGSSSGYQYGAYVRLSCDDLKIDEIIAEW